MHMKNYRFIPTFPVFETGSEAVYHLARMLAQYGEKRSPRGQATREVRDMTFQIENPEHAAATNIDRGLRPAIAGAEALQLIGGFSDPAAMGMVSAKFKDFMDHGELMGAYGPRVGNEMQKVIDLLYRDPDTRQAVVTVYSSYRDLHPHTQNRDVPCTLTLTFFIRHDELCMKTHMRSNDVWLGLPYDLVQFTQLQLTVARSLGIIAGPYTHHVDSFHVYDRDLEKVDGLVNPNGHGQQLEGLRIVEGRRRWDQAKLRASLLFYNRLGHVTDINWPQSFNEMSPTERWLTEALHKKILGDPR